MSVFILLNSLYVLAVNSPLLRLTVNAHLVEMIGTDRPAGVVLVFREAACNSLPAAVGPVKMSLSKTQKSPHTYSLGGTLD